MREATEADVGFVAGAIAAIAAELRDRAADPYVAGLPELVGEAEREFVRGHLRREDALVLVEEIDGRPVACLVGDVGPTAFAPAGIGDVGRISVVWVEPASRRRGIARKLVAAAEIWFHHRGVGIVELAYLAANTSAAAAWQLLGFAPFRVWAYKPIKAK